LRTVDGRRIRSIATLKTHAPILGCILWCAAIDQDAVNSLIRQAGAIGLPVSALDDSGELRWDALRLPPLVRAVSQHPNARAGCDAGRFLSRLGHSQVAYISHVSQAGWSVQRLQGLRQVIEDPGIGGRVQEFGLPGTVQGDFIDPVHRSRVLRLITSNAPGEPVSGGATSLRELTDHYVDELIESNTVARMIEPHLDNALACPEITAWVASCDAVAVVARAFLQRRGVKIPGRLSILGFDDAFEAFVARITSYNFNGQAAAVATLEHVLAARRPKGDAGAMEIGGYVTERATTGRAKTGR
jgi:DNA-binding LacI/PurR family transcriptional regulator